MKLVQLPECGGFDLGWADRLRKSIAKKNPAEYEQLTKEYFENMESKNLSRNLCNYVWNVLVATSRGYGFNASHTLAYSLVGLQEMNLAYRLPDIFWNCACLIANSGGAEDEDDEEENEEIVDIYEEEDFSEFDYEDAPDRKTKIKKRKANKYGKIATAIGQMRAAGVSVTPPDINNSRYTFYPDVENNRILFGLRGLVNVGDDIIEQTIANRPYSSPRDYLQKVQPKKSSMLSLIKAGAFDNLLDRKMCMAWFLWEVCDKKSNLTLQNMPGLIRYNLLPTDTEEQRLAGRVYEFNRYLKAYTKAVNPSLIKITYLLDERAINFLTEIGEEQMISKYNNNWWAIDVKTWDKYYQKTMNIFRNWIAADKENILNNLNSLIFKDEWIEYAKNANLSAWEMEAMCYYYHPHELINIDKEKYGISNFFDLPEEPIVERIFYKGDAEIKLYKLTHICGTCIDKNKNKSTVTLLTPDGVVKVKFNKEYFSMFNKQISEKLPDGTKKIMERSWFNKGNKILVTGMRSGDNFIAKRYSATPGHTLYKIDEIFEDGSITLQTERYGS